MLPQFFARRYLFSPKSRSVVNLISGLSVVAVAMPVAAMIILLSVFNGFESLVKSMYSAFDADLTVSARLGQTFPADAIDTAAVARIPGVEAFSFVLEQSALLEHAGRQATATVRGVDDAYAAVFPLDSVVSAGEYRVRLGDIERLVMGQSMTYMLGACRCRCRCLRRAPGFVLLAAAFRQLYAADGAPRRGLFARPGDGADVCPGVAAAGTGAFQPSRPCLGARRPPAGGGRCGAGASGSGAADGR